MERFFGRSAIKPMKSKTSNPARGWLESDFESDTKELRSSDRRWPTASAVGWGVWKSEPRSGERPFSWIGFLSPPHGAFGDRALLPHGLRRGLPSSASPWLAQSKCWRQTIETAGY